jgi:hypothetical protein
VSRTELSGRSRRAAHQLINREEASPPSRPTAGAAGFMAPGGFHTIGVMTAMAGLSSIE